MGEWIGQCAPIPILMHLMIAWFNGWFVVAFIGFARTLYYEFLILFVRWLDNNLNSICIPTLDDDLKWFISIVRDYKKIWLIIMKMILLIVSIIFSIIYCIALLYYLLQEFSFLLCYLIFMNLTLRKGNEKISYAHLCLHLKFIHDLSLFAVRKFLYMMKFDGMCFVNGINSSELRRQIKRLE